MRAIEALTFDLWDTVIIDDSDEPKRAAAGLPTKAAARRALLHQALSAVAPVERAMVDLAYDVADSAFRKVWDDQSVTWTVRERLDVLLRGLGRSLPEFALAELVRVHEDMELVVSPDPVPGAVEAIRALKGRVPMAVISDTVFSPGRALRTLLDRWGVLDCFDCFVFSDEAGWAKPRPEVYHQVARTLGVSVEGIVHLGDREDKDVRGAHRVGGRAVYITVAKDRGSATTTAEAICRDYADLPGILAGLGLGAASGR